MKIRRVGGVTDRPFRVGVIYGRPGDIATWAADLRRVESAGYATALMPDTTFTPAPLVALAAAAAATETLHVGTWVLCDPLRDARRVVWEAGTLANLCGDRFELGLGAGRPDAGRDADRLGVPFNSPRERVDALVATLDAVQAAIPDVRVMVAASGPRLLALAGQRADIVALGWPPTTDAAGAGERIRIVRDAAGDRADEVELASGLVAVGPETPPWLARDGLTPADLIERGAVTVATGSPQQMADQLRQRRDALGLSYITVPSERAEMFAPVVELLAGT
jgi:probable F420-dependent oxidoreductase